MQEFVRDNLMRLYYAQTNDLCMWRFINLPDHYDIHYFNQTLEVINSEDCTLFINLGFCWKYEVKELTEYELVEEYIRNFIETSNNKYECDDNYRFYEIGDVEQEHVYLRKKYNGCCGSYDAQHTINGKEYMIGFNYGH